MLQPQSLAPAALFALVLGVSTSVAHVAAAPLSASPTVEQRVGENPEDLVARNAMVMSYIKAATKKLLSLSQSLELGCKLIATEYVLRKGAYEEPFTQVAAELRAIESFMSEKWQQLDLLPVIGGEARKLRKLLAQTRSLAARNSMMLKQMISDPAYIKGQADPEGLKALAQIGTERAGQLAAKRV